MRTWEEYRDDLRNIHGRRFTREVEYFCRYTWKDAIALCNQARQNGESPEPTTNTASTPCEHEWKTVSDGFICATIKCVKCGEVTDNMGAYCG